MANKSKKKRSFSNANQEAASGNPPAAEDGRSSKKLKLAAQRVELGDVQINGIQVESVLEGFDLLTMLEIRAIAHVDDIMSSGMASWGKFVTAMDLEGIVPDAQNFEVFYFRPKAKKGAIPIRNDYNLNSAIRELYKDMCEAKHQHDQIRIFFCKDGNVNSVPKAERNFLPFSKIKFMEPYNP